MILKVKNKKNQHARQKKVENFYKNNKNSYKEEKKMKNSKSIRSRKCLKRETYYESFKGKSKISRIIKSLNSYGRRKKKKLFAKLEGHKQLVCR